MSSNQLALVGVNFKPGAPIVIWSQPEQNSLRINRQPATTLYAGSDGAITVLLDELPMRIPAQGWFVGQESKSGNETEAIAYQFDPTATPTLPPSATPTQTPTVPPTAIPSPATPTMVPSATQDQNPTEAWFAEYFDNRDLIRPPFFTRNEFPSSDWQCTCELPDRSDATRPLDMAFQRPIISARWTGIWEFANTDNYVFKVWVSDGVRILVDGVPILNDWRTSSKTRELLVSHPVTQGQHKVVIEYFNAKGKGSISVSWRVGYPQWEGRYYNTVNWFGDVIAKRNDGSPSGPFEFTWDASPAPGVNADNFSVYWSRTIKFSHTCWYRFTGWADDGIRIFIDDAEVFRQNTDMKPGDPTYSFDYYLRSGPHKIQIHYYELAGTARIRFAWDCIPPTPTPEPTPVL